MNSIYFNYADFNDVISFLISIEMLKYRIGHHNLINFRSYLKKNHTELQDKLFSISNFI